MKSITVKPLLKVTAFLCLSFATLLTAQAFEMDPPDETDIADSEETYSNQAVNKTNPYKMIKTVAGLTFDRFANESENIKKDPNILKDVVAEELMPYINYKYSAFKVIGKHLRNTTKEDREAFVPVFRDYLVTSYAQVFTLYDNQQVLFAAEQNFSDKNIVSVKTQIVMPGRDNIDVSFKVRINKKTKEWKAYDMVAEGVSLLDSKQAELGGLIRQKGLPYVTEMLKEKSKRDIVFKNEKG